jgi:hypothetical protein
VLGQQFSVLASSGLAKINSAFIEQLVSYASQVKLLLALRLLIFLDLN